MAEQRFTCSCGIDLAAEGEVKLSVCENGELDVVVTCPECETARWAFIPISDFVEGE